MKPDRRVDARFSTGRDVFIVIIATFPPCPYQISHPDVDVMQAADLGYGYDPPDGLNNATKRRVFG